MPGVGAGVREEACQPRQAQAEGLCGVAEDFDFEAFCEHYDITIKFVREDVWHVVEECPGVGRRHEQSTLTAFYWDGSSLGWNCFAQDCDLCGKTIGNVVKYLADRAREEGKEPYRG